MEQSIDAELCMICQTTIVENIESASIQRNDFHAHHGSWDSLLDAIEKGCYICSKLWKVSQRASDAASYEQKTKTTSTKFRCYKDRTTQKLVKLEVSLIAESFKISPDYAVKFRLITLKSDDFQTTSSISALPVDQRTDSEATLNLALEWLKTCTQHHDLCLSPSKRFVGSRPTRLVEISYDNANNITWTVRSAESASASFFEKPYMTMSYRWASNPTFLLQNSTLEQFTKNQRLSDLPATFRDAILVANHFSVQYLWIDALCIIQDSKQDWKQEAPRMRDIYANSICNIAASAATDQDSGFFVKRHEATILPRKLRLRKRDRTLGPDGSILLLFEKDYWNQQLEDSALHSRGWVFQECLLAPRVLYFGDHQVLWRCLEESKCEGFPNGIPYDDSPCTLENVWVDFEFPRQSSRLPESTTTLWTNLVEEYSQCQLTHTSDKLAAFEGIAQLFGDIMHDRYFYGIWTREALRLLQWFLIAPQEYRPAWRAPSWSWAATDGAVQHFLAGNPHHVLAKSLEITTVQRETQSELFSPKVACLKISTIIVPCKADLKNGRCEIHMADGPFVGKIYSDVARVRDVEVLHLLPLQSFAICDSSGRSCSDYQATGLLLRQIGPLSFIRAGFWVTSSHSDLKALSIGSRNGKELLDQLFGKMVEVSIY